jgi:hypothetical protein
MEHPEGSERMAEIVTMLAVVGEALAVFGRYACLGNGHRNSGHLQGSRELGASRCRLLHRYRAI